MASGTLIAITLFLLPITFYLIKAHYYWGLKWHELFENWPLSTMLGMALLVTYLILIMILGHRGLAGFENGTSASFEDSWLFYYLLPGYVLAMIILPRSVAKGWLGSDGSSEELALVYGWVALICLSAYLLFDWYHF